MGESVEHSFGDGLSVRNLTRQGETDQYTGVDPPQGTYCLASGINPANGAACTALGTSCSHELTRSK